MRPFLLFAGACGLAAAPAAHALQLRNYSPATHDRFTGFPTAPVANPGFLYDEAKFTGVGWCVETTGQQFALITPRHLLCAAHYPPGIGQHVAFLDSTGAQVTRTVAALKVIIDPVNGGTDVCLVTLDAEAPATVKPFPYLNLASESAYLNTPVMVFGMYARAGRGTLGGFDDLTEAGLFNNVRCSYFNYGPGGSDNDCHFEVGDSGSPTFATVAGQPALIGAHSALDSGFGTYTNYDTFLPHYAALVDTELDPAGYRLRPAHATASQLQLAATALPGTLRRANAGQIAFTVTNTGGQLTGNLRLSVTFPAGQAPDSMIAPAGWLVEPVASGTWLLRRSTLAAGANAIVTASWSHLPDTASLSPALQLQSDAAPDATSSPVFELAPSYAAWAQGLPAAGRDDDPDQDGLSNLLEYALGGDPQQSDRLLAGVHPLLPAATLINGSFRFSFPQRDDFETRGLAYLIETSTDLVTWSTTLPAGAQSTTQPWSSAVAGFQQRIVTWPLSGPQRFARLRVELDEE